MLRGRLSAFGIRARSLAALLEKLADRKVKLATRYIDAHDVHFDHIPDADLRAASFAADEPAAVVDVPPVVHE